jgi:DNA repair protein RecN (Recombination protein N)
MLTELYVENFALIENLHVYLTSGLNVLTGETGAGKSLIIDAVGLLMGGRASQDFIRRGANKALVQGVFSLIDLPDLADDLKEAGFQLEEDTVILSREIMRSGKNISRINFRIVPLSFFRDISRRLINIHGQHEHITLLEEHNQLTLLDSFGGEEILDLKEKIKLNYHEVKRLEKQLEKLNQDVQDAARRQDYLSYQVKEIESAQLLPREEEELLKEVKILRNTERLVSETHLAYEKLYGSREPGANDLISQAINILKDLAPLDPKIEQIMDKVNEVYYLLEDVIGEIKAYSENVISISNPNRLESVENRLILINKLKNKYGNSVEDILEFVDQAKNELEKIISRDNIINKLEENLIKEQEKYRLLCTKLTKLRMKAGDELSQAITKELNQLQMDHAKFAVEITESEKKSTGVDNVQFLISPNPGEDFKPVARFASGGEMSRIMLGIKVILAQIDKVPTLIFDEIDSGLGGKAVYSVAEKLEFISYYTQIICVTHSPVVASFAHNHLHIFKECINGRTLTTIIKLKGEQILNELSRMLAGDYATETTIAQAKN